MSATDDDRKQRFRFHKDDEIKLLQIVLRAKPCPYKITSRDGSIMIAWNNIAEEFKTICTPRPDGNLPHPRTCRTRCDKMLSDRRAMRGSAHLKTPKQESKEDKIKNELLERLEALQAKAMDSNAGSTLGAVATGVTGYGGDAGLNSSGSGSGSGSGSVSSLVSPGHFLAQGQGSSSAGTSIMNDSQPHRHAHQQHRGLAASATVSTVLTPQSLSNLGNHNHRIDHAPSMSEILADPRLLLPATAISGIHDDHHQVSSSDVFSVTASDVHSRMNRSKPSSGTSTSTGHKRRGNNNTEITVAAAIMPSSSSSQHNANTFDYVQRSSPLSSNQNHHPNLSSHASKRSRPSAGTGKPSPSSYMQQGNGHNSGQARSALGTISIGSGLSGQDLTGSSGVGIHVESDDDEDNDEDDDEDDDDGGFQDTQEDLGNDYEDDFDNGIDDEEDDQDERLHVPSLPSYQSGSLMVKNDGQNNRGSKRKSAPGAGNAASASSTLRAQTGGKSRRSSNQGLQRHPSGGLGKSGLSFGSIFGSSGYTLPSHVNKDDREYLMKALALEEQRMKVEEDKIALEREKLALERQRLQWEMRHIPQ
ncbi:hypothetical protein EDD21DRAFT_360699 [Dissophora ornata]|nr:hypothetical protein BGZ58_000993 [Dissophora ornata]KAI8606518.1 hypothetical protein EDD21DRAFT_360699 [Dissophora ornata]